MVRALASHQCGRGSNPGVDAICGLSLLLVLSLAPRGFSPGTPVFPSPQKPAFPNSNSTRNQVDEEPLCGCATCKSLSIYLFYLFTRRVSKIRGYFAGKSKCSMDSTSVWQKAHLSDSTLSKRKSFDTV